MKKIKINRNKKIGLISVLIIIFILIITLIFMNKKNIFYNALNTKEKMESNVEISYKRTKLDFNSNQISIVLIASSSDGIEKIITPDGEEITATEFKNKLAIDYTLNCEQDYIFRIKPNNGDIKEEKINLHKPDEIYTIEELEEINLELSGNYKLMNSLDFHNRENYKTDEKYEYYNKDEDGDGNPDNSWVPIGKNKGRFNGIFDGDYYTISNLYINNQGSSSGLFSETSSNSSLYHIVLDKCTVIADGNTGSVGCLAGYVDGIVYECKVSNSSVTNATVHWGDAYGALVGNTDYWWYQAHHCVQRCTTENCLVISWTNNGLITGFGDVRDSYVSGTLKSTFAGNEGFGRMGNNK